MSTGVHGRAEVVRGEQARFASAAGYPTVLWKDRAEMPCGCAVLVGVRLDLQEPAVVFTNCEDDGHFDTMAVCRDLYAKSLAEGREGEAVRVAAELLSRAFNLEEARDA